MRRGLRVIAVLASTLASGCVDRTEAGSFLADASGSGGSTPVETADADEPTASIPRATTALTSAVSSSCALDAKGGVYCWGSNLGGALGIGVVDAEFHSSPMAVKGLSQGVAALAGGNQSFCAVLAEGAVRCWGNLPSGGNAEPTVVPGIDFSVARVTVGDGFWCTLDTRGRARCWGAGSAGQLGNRSTDDRLQPSESVATDEALVDISASSFSAFACGVSVRGRVLCWGSGAGGQLGRAEHDRAIPVPVDGLVDPAQSVATGSLFACALLRDGGVACWGTDDMGQLGSGRPGGDPTPRRVPGVSAVIAIALGESHACALVKDGAVVCWGGGYRGAIPGQAKIAAPTQVIPASFGAIAIAAGYQSTCALAGNGRVRCFGSAGISWSADASFTL